MKDDATVDETTKLDSCNTDSSSSVIGRDRTSVVSNVETTSQTAVDVVASVATGNDTVECSSTEPAIGTELELIISDTPTSVTDVLFNADDHCDVAKAVEADSVETVGTDTLVVCETVNENVCDPVVNESLPLSSDVPVTFPIAPTELATVITGDDDDPADMQLDVAECVEISDAAD